MLEDSDADTTFFGNERSPMTIVRHAFSVFHLDGQELLIVFESNYGKFLNAFETEAKRNLFLNCNPEEFVCKNKLHHLDQTEAAKSHILTTHSRMKLTHLTG